MNVMAQYSTAIQTCLPSVNTSSTQAYRTHNAQGCNQNLWRSGIGRDDMRDKVGSHANDSDQAGGLESSTDLEGRAQSTMGRGRHVVIFGTGKSVVICVAIDVLMKLSGSLEKGLWSTICGKSVPLGGQEIQIRGLQCSADELGVLAQELPKEIAKGECMVDDKDLRPSPGLLYTYAGTRVKNISKV